MPSPSLLTHIDIEDNATKPQQKSLRVAVLGTRGFPGVQGGVEAHCENLYPLLVQKGCEVFVFTRLPYMAQQIDDFSGVKLIHLSCPKHKFLEAIVHSLKALIKAKSIKPDIVHIHAIGPSIVAPLAKLLGMKVIVTHHGQDYLREKWAGFPQHFLKFCEKMGTQFADEVIVIEQSIGTHLKERYQKQAIVIPNGVVAPNPITSNDVLNHFGLEKQKYFLTAGRFVPEKGFHDLVKAFKEYSNKRKDRWKLVIVGDADHQDQYSQNLKKMIQETPDVISTGSLKKPALGELFQHCATFVLPSYHEGLPIVLLEAMSFGVPCLASNIAGNKSVPLEERCYFTAGNIEEISLKLLHQHDIPILEEDRIMQIDLVKYLFNWETIAQKTLDTYESLLMHEKPHETSVV